MFARTIVSAWRQRPLGRLVSGMVARSEKGVPPLVAGVLTLALAGNATIGLYTYQRRKARQDALGSVVAADTAQKASASLTVDAIEALAQEVFGTVSLASESGSVPRSGSARSGRRRAC